MIRAPVVVEAEDGVSIFDSVEHAESYMEAIDVAEGVYRAVFDSEGRVLNLTTGNDADGAFVQINSTEFHRPDELRQLLSDWLVRLERAPDGLESMSLAEVMEFCEREGLVERPTGIARGPVGCLVVVVFVILGIVGSIVAMRHYSGRTFDAAVWNDPARETDHVRAKMVDGFIAQGTLMGMSRDEVVAMLGEPPETEYFSEYDMVYWLGQERGFVGIDSEWLVIKLDDSGRVEEYDITTD